MKEKVNTHAANASTEVDCLLVYDCMYKHFAQSCYIHKNKLHPHFMFEEIEI